VVELRRERAALQVVLPAAHRSHAEPVALAAREVRHAEGALRDEPGEPVRVQGVRRDAVEAPLRPVDLVPLPPGHTVVEARFPAQVDDRGAGGPRQGVGRLHRSHLVGLIEPAGVGVVPDADPERVEAREVIREPGDRGPLAPVGEVPAARRPLVAHVVEVRIARRGVDDDPLPREDAIPDVVNLRDHGGLVPRRRRLLRVAVRRAGRREEGREEEQAGDQDGTAAAGGSRVRHGESSPSHAEAGPRPAPVHPRSLAEVRGVYDCAAGEGEAPSGPPARESSRRRRISVSSSWLDVASPSGSSPGPAGPICEIDARRWLS